MNWFVYAIKLLNGTVMPLTQVDWILVYLTFRIITIGRHVSQWLRHTWDTCFTYLSAQLWLTAPLQFQVSTKVYRRKQMTAWRRVTTTHMEGLDWIPRSWLWTIPVLATENKQRMNRGNFVSAFQINNFYKINVYVVRSYMWILMMKLKCSYFMPL